MISPFVNTKKLYALITHDRPLGDIRTADKNHDRHKDQEDQNYEHQPAKDGRQEDQGEDHSQQEEIHTNNTTRKSPSKHIGAIEQEHQRREQNGDTKGWHDTKEPDEIGDKQIIEHIDHPKEEIMECIELYGKHL